jgi:uncharacterized membrane protein
VIRIGRTLRNRPRLVVCMTIGAALGLLLPERLHPATRTLAGWDAATALYLVSVFVMMGRATPATMRARAEREDEGRWAILGFGIAAACVSLGAIVSMLAGTKDLPSPIAGLHVALAAVTVLLSWLFLHTMFALHYAHDYYGSSGERGAHGMRTRGGLAFPDEKAPDYWDFLYFSFVIGMTGQVSDVAVSSRSLRRLTLLHGVIAFFFNTVILALTINIAASLF